MMAASTQPLLAALVLACVMSPGITSALPPVSSGLDISSQTNQGSPNSTETNGCYRVCDGTVKVCKYTFIEEIYNALNSACGDCVHGRTEDCWNPECIPLDGVERSVYSINRQVPGPAIHACVGDTIEVTLDVRMPGHGETMHWHGLFHKQTPFMDGVSSITQCPVNAGSKFQYRFLAERAGTFFYHSHNGINKVNGGVGPMVFRDQPGQDPQSLLYDRDLSEHEVFLMDWMHSIGEDVFPGLSHPFGQVPATILINGKGNFRNGNGEYTLTPNAEFVVERGLRYRFRVTNSGWGSCPIGLRILNHNMTIIAADTWSVEPKVIDTLYSGSGERFDFVLNANQGGVHYVHVFTAGFCEKTNLQVDQVGILRYSDAEEGSLPLESRPTVDNMGNLRIELNSATCGDHSSSLCITKLRTLNKPSDKLMKTTPDQQTVVSVGFHTYNDNRLYNNTAYPKFLTIGASQAGTLNNIAFRSPASPPLTQYGASPLCEKCENGRDSDFCICTHILRLPKNQVVDLLLVEKTKVSMDTTAILAHPMHIHGYSFYVLATGSLWNITDGEERVSYVKDHAADLVTSSGRDRPPLKDTLLLPGGGYAIVRLYTDNPGMWFFHCHFQYHMASGMEAIVQVGEPDDFVKPPPNFPTCGDFKLGND